MSKPYPGCGNRQPVARPDRKGRFGGQQLAIEAILSRQPRHAAVQSPFCEYRVMSSRDNAVQHIPAQSAAWQ